MRPSRRIGLRHAAVPEVALDLPGVEGDANDAGARRLAGPAVDDRERAARVAVDRSPTSRS